MNLYLLSQTQNNGYDTFDACIVAAETENDARTIPPADYASTFSENYPCWASTFEAINVRLLGTALPETPRGVILASFNAG